MTSEQEKLITELQSGKPTINTIEELLKDGLHPNYTEPTLNCTPLHYAVLLPKAKGRNKIVQLLINHHADLHAKGGCIKNYVGGLTPYGLAIAEGNSELIQLLVTNNHFPSVNEVIKEFPFTKKKGTLDFLKYLLSLLARPLTKEDMFTLLKGAIQGKNEEILLYLLSLKPDLSFSPISSPLIHYAIYSDTIMKALLLAGANPNVFETLCGYSLLHIAIWSNDHDNVELLKTIFSFSRITVDVNIRSTNALAPGITNPIFGITPLAHYCCFPQDCLLNTISFLLDQQADVNATDAQFGNTPLHYAFVSNSFKTAALLLSKGADPNAVNVKGQTPIEKIADPELRARIKQELCI